MHTYLSSYSLFKNKAGPNLKCLSQKPSKTTKFSHPKWLIIIDLYIYCYIHINPKLGILKWKYRRKLCYYYIYNMVMICSIRPGSWPGPQAYCCHSPVILSWMLQHSAAQKGCIKWRVLSLQVEFVLTSSWTDGDHVIRR